MGFRKYFSGEDAARYAATITDKWQNEDGEIWDADTLIDVMNCADGENPLDEEFDDEYYVVDDNGALGFVAENRDIYWYVTLEGVTTEEQEEKVRRERENGGNSGAGKAAPENARPEEGRPKFCTNCGAKIEEGWAFCNKCGKKL